MKLTPEQHTKFNYLSTFMTGFCLIFYCFTFTRKCLFNNDLTSKPMTIQNPVRTGWTLPPFGPQFETLKLVNFGTIFTCILTMVQIVVTSTCMDTIPVEKLVAYPYYFLIHFFFHGAPFFRNFCLVAVYLSKSETMRIVLLRELLDKIKYAYLFMPFKSHQKTNVISVKI